MRAKFIRNSSRQSSGHRQELCRPSAVPAGRHLADGGETKTGTRGVPGSIGRQRVHQPVKDERGSNFASLFLHAVGHIQHHYTYASKVYDGNRTNPNWYNKAAEIDGDPLVLCWFRLGVRSISRSAILSIR
jgi:hypothetical protein